jgi:hypothetical protein
MPLFSEEGGGLLKTVGFNGGRCFGSSGAVRATRIGKNSSYYEVMLARSCGDRGDFRAHRSCSPGPCFNLEKNLDTRSIVHRMRQRV